MKLLLRRHHRRGAFHRVIFGLDVRAQLSETEHAAFAEYDLWRTNLYGRSELTEPGHGLLGIVYRAGFSAFNLTLSAADLVGGKRMEFVSLTQVLSAEDQIRASAVILGQLLDAAVNYDGEEVLHL